MEEIMEELHILWNYLCLNNNPKKSECIIGLGSILTLVPKRCAKLFNEKLGDYIIFSGNCGKGTKDVIEISEAERFKGIAIEENVPAEKIFVEEEATTTYENYKYIIKVLKENNLNPSSFLIVGKPYQERRAFAIAELQLKDKEFQIGSYNMSLEDYLEFVKSDPLMKIEDVANEMVGEIKLMLIAPKFELQSEQVVPVEVIKATEKIIRAGFDKYDYTDEVVKSFK